MDFTAYIWLLLDYVACWYDFEFVELNAFREKVYFDFLDKFLLELLSWWEFNTHHTYDWQSKNILLLGFRLIMKTITIMWILLK